jgi:signal peptidase I
MSKFAAFVFGLALGAAAVFAITTATAAPTGLHSTESASMQPTIRQGDRFLADRSFYRVNTPRHGEVAVYLHPRLPGVVYIKRIVALGGDRIAIRDGRVILNGVAIDEPYAMPGDPNTFHSNMPEITVPQGQVFVLGDNRAMSSDSRVRSHGMVPVDNLRGRATFIVWSSDFSRVGRYVGTIER